VSGVIENVVIYGDDDLVRVERRIAPASIVRARERMAVVIDYGGRSFGDVQLSQTLANPDFAEALLRVLPNVANDAQVAEPGALVGVYQTSQGRRVTASGLVRGALSARRQQVMTISPWAIVNGGPNHARLELANLLRPLDSSANVSVSVDGREMPSGHGWEVSGDGLAINAWIPSASDIDGRARHMQASYWVRWYE
jgi:hypothetical protein